MQPIVISEARHKVCFAIHAILAKYIIAILREYLPIATHFVIPPLILLKFTIVIIPKTQFGEKTTNRQVT